MSDSSGMFQRFLKNYEKYLRAKTKKQVANDYWEKYIAEGNGGDASASAQAKQKVLAAYRETDRYRNDLDMALWENESLRKLLEEDPEEVARLRTIYDSEIGLIRGNLKRNQGINIGKVLRSYEKKQQAANYEPDRTVPEMAAEFLPEFTEGLIAKLEKYYTTQRVRVFGLTYDGRPASIGWLNADNVGDYLKVYDEAGLLEPILYKYVLQGMPPAYSFALELSHRYRLPKTGSFVSKSAGEITSAGLMGEVYHSLYAALPTDRVIALLKKNGRYGKIMKHYESEQKRLRHLHENMLREIPDNYIELYPLARRMDRHFIIHAGPTNSGKTYQAIEALKAAETGIYLGPLRLLAYEQFENMNFADVPCNLLTGEETVDIPGAKHQASTVEMLNLSTIYDCAVIDEAQMIADKDRGGAWTTAVLGVCAEEVHICCAMNAVQLLIHLIEDCEDTYEVVYHQRQTRLALDNETFDFPVSVKEKDALIVFSRRNVHAVASELQRRGVLCSVIYGALPYDVRHEEARKFMNGETQVVVATDAIGLGMNLPIRRIVFLEQSKYDGEEVRYLKPDEVQQIAGRAGRRGMYEIGFVNSFGEKRFIRKQLLTENPPLDSAVIDFPPSLLGLDAQLSDILKRWNDIPEKAGYHKADLTLKIELCEQLEELSDDKDLIYRFLMIPFDEKEDALRELWVRLFLEEQAGRTVRAMDYLPYCGEIPNRVELQDLEYAYKVCDLLYYYLERFGQDEELPEVREEKRVISEGITELLEKQQLPENRCKRCGRRLPWNYRYRVCESCHLRSRTGYGRRHYNRK